MYGNEDDLRRLRGMAEVSGELNLATGPVPAQQLGEKPLVNRHHALVKLIHLVFIIVDAQDPVADFGEACGCHQANVSRSDYCDCNRFAHLVFWFRLGFNMSCCNYCPLG